MGNVKLQSLPYYIGYLKDPHDQRDYTIETFNVPSKFTPLKNSSSETEKEKQTLQLENQKFATVLNEKFNIADTPMTDLTPKYDFIKSLTSIRDQLNLGSCTSFAAS